MNIKPFRIKISKISNEESRILQEILFKNGYTWGSGVASVLYPKNIDHIVFRDCVSDGVPRIYYNHSNNCDIDIPLITFEEFMIRYDIKGQRLSKLNKLNSINNFK